MDRKKIIKGLEHCFHGQECCGDIECPYYIEHLSDCCCLEECQQNLKTDAITLVKEQNAYIEHLEEMNEKYGYINIVRCNDCIFGEQINDRYICTNAKHCQSKSNTPDWFCADGNRKGR